MSATPRQVFHVPSGTTRPEILARVHRFLDKLPADHPYVVEIREHKPRRSDAQNAYLWAGIYPAILAAGGEQLRGWTAGDLHDFMLGEWGGWESPEGDGFGRKRVKPIRRSSNLNKQEFSDFVEFIRVKMAGHGIDIPEAQP